MVNSIKGILGCEDWNFKITKRYGKELSGYIDKLISDVQYRAQEGTLLKDKLMTVAKFDNLLGKILSSTYDETLSIVDENTGHKYLLEINLKLQNEYQPSIITPLVFEYGFRTLFKFYFL